MQVRSEYKIAHKYRDESHSLFAHHFRIHYDLFGNR